MAAPLGILVRGRSELGRLGLTGACLLAMAMVLTALGLRSVAQATEQRSVLERLRRDTGAATAPSSLPAPIVEHEAPVLPTRSEVTDVLAELARIAQSAGVDASAAQYDYMPSSATVPAQLELRLALRARYVTARSFIANALSAIPALSLREISIARDGTDADPLKVELRWVLLLEDRER